MGLDREKQKMLQSAEQLLRQGKVQQALHELERVGSPSSVDPLTLNRMADLLARQGQRQEAIQYYLRIAKEFSRGGFLPKAIAIHKKILRLDPQHTDSLLKLGELYLQLTLPGEARDYLLRAAQLFLESRAFAEARGVYEILVRAEPDDPRHRARLAETRAAEGDSETAAWELVALGDSLFTSGKPREAEQSYRRAAEMLPGEPEPLLGICRCLKEQGQEAEGLGMLEKAAADADAPASILGELAVQYEMIDRGDETLDLLKRPQAHEIPADALCRLFCLHLERSDVEEFWERMDPVFAVWADQGSPAKVEALLARLAEIERQGHIPALRRLAESTERSGDRAGTIRALEELVQAYRARALNAEAAEVVERLQELAPESGAVRESAAETATPPAPESAPSTDSAEPVPNDARASLDGEDAPSLLDAEAPAVPLNRSDEETVAGRLTQAEILEKYGLLDQARQQIREVVDRFPGHLPAQERRVALARATSAREELREALIGLALARRAAGNLPAARESAAEAARSGEIATEQRELLERLGLLDPPPTERAEASSLDSPRAAGAPSSSREPDAGAVVIEFEAVDEEVAEPARAPRAADAPAPRRGRPVRAPGADMLEEIRLVLDAGAVEDARRRIMNLRALGYASEELDRLQEEIQRKAQPVSLAPEPEPVEASAGPGAASEEEDDLSAITAALEDELFTEPAGEEPVAAESNAEQSLEDVFAVFRQHVAEEVGAGDFRTHYDLGIGYKEMGLLDEAVQEFQLAVTAPEVEREAAIMLALCHRERGELEEAATWYRRAIASSSGDDEARSGLRYDLAELLLSREDPEGALSTFRELEQSDPSFRDVRDRIAQIEALLPS